MAKKIQARRVPTETERLNYMYMWLNSDPVISDNGHMKFCRKATDMAIKIATKEGSWPNRAKSAR